MSHGLEVINWFYFISFFVVESLQTQKLLQLTRQTTKKKRIGFELHETRDLIVKKNCLRRAVSSSRQIISSMINCVELFESPTNIDRLCSPSGFIDIALIWLNETVFNYSRPGSGFEVNWAIKELIWVESNLDPLSKNDFQTLNERMKRYED